jgi:predicted TIM-barrel fold metal-dependent hydrolase
MIVDADTHVIEGEHTWDFLEPHEQRFRPQMVPKWWIVDGVARHRTFEDNDIPMAVRDLTDVRGRVERMDQLGVDVQVVYPSLQLVPTTERPEALLALCKSYNRFMADACGKSNGRLRWVLIPPVETLPEALAEVDFGAGHGACGIFMRGMEGTRMLANRYFNPLYEKAQALNLPICVHTGNGNRAVWDLTFQDDFPSARFPVVCAMQSLLLQSVPDRFPGLRFGFIEAGAQWVPYSVREVIRTAAVRARQGRGDRGIPADEKQVIPSNRLFISCRTDDDLEYILRWTGPRNLMTASDYGHDDTATELFFVEQLPRLGNITDDAIHGLLGANAQTFYGIDDLPERMRPSRN